MLRYKRPDERKILDDAMAIILPVVYQRLISLMPDESEYSVLLQKQILKVFYAFIQVLVLGDNEHIHATLIVFLDVLFSLMCEIFL